MIIKWFTNINRAVYRIDVYLCFATASGGFSNVNTRAPRCSIDDGHLQLRTSHKQAQIQAEQQQMRRNSLKSAEEIFHPLTPLSEEYKQRNKTRRKSQL